MTRFLRRNLSGPIRAMRTARRRYRTANNPAMAQWKPGSEFQAKRDAMLQPGGGSP